MTRVTVFGAGVMGTAMAIHLARLGNDTALWAAPYDEAILPSLLGERKHPSLPEYLPASLKVLGPNQLGAAGDSVEIAVMGAHSGGARNLARLVKQGIRSLPLVAGVAKGLEPDTHKRMSQVYAEEAGHDRVLSIGGPCLAAELAQGFPTAAVFAAPDMNVAEEGAAAFGSPNYHVVVTDDVVGAEYCTVAKNVAAIALGMLDGLGSATGAEYKNAKSALFTHAVVELVELVSRLGGRAETATGLAGLGDTLVTSLGGRNRLYGELVGVGRNPRAAHDDLTRLGMTVEGVESTRQVRHLAERVGLELPLHTQVHRVLFEGAPPRTVLDLVKG